MGLTWGPPGADRTQVGPCKPDEPCYQGHPIRKSHLSPCWVVRFHAWTWITLHLRSTHPLPTKMWPLRRIILAFITVGERTVALKIIARGSITQTPTGQSKVWWWHARKMVMIYFKRTEIHCYLASFVVYELRSNFMTSMKLVFP